MVLQAECIGDAADRARRVNHDDIETHPVPHPLRMVGQHDFSRGKQSHLLSRTERHRRIGQGATRFDLDNRQNIGSGRDDVDFTGAGAQTLRQDGPTVARQGTTRRRFGIDAALIRSSHPPQLSGRSIMTG